MLAQLNICARSDHSPSIHFELDKAFVESSVRVKHLNIGRFFTSLNKIFLFKEHVKGARLVAKGNDELCFSIADLWDFFFDFQYFEDRKYALVRLHRLSEDIVWFFLLHHHAI